MAILEVQNLLRPITREQAMADIITLAQGMGLRAGSWRIGSRARFWIVSLSDVVSRMSSHVALIAANGFNATAWGHGLTKFSRSRYDNTRTKAVKTQGTIRLEDEGDVGPITIQASERVFAYSEDPSITFRNVTGGTLPQGGTLELTIEAETGGSRHNVPINTITSMSPTIAGIEVTNPANPTDWITRLGVDEERDDVLQSRNPNRWDTLSGNGPRGYYDHLAKTAVDSLGDPVGITRTYVDDQNPGGPGTIYVYVADDNGTASMQQVDDVQAYVDQGKARCSLVTVFAATPLVVNITADIRVTAGTADVAKAAIENALEEYINALPIGGEDIGESLGRVVWSQLVEVIMAVEDVRRVSLTTPSIDLTVQPNEVVTLGTVTLNATEV